MKLIERLLQWFISAQSSELEQSCAQPGSVLGANDVGLEEVLKKQAEKAKKM